MKQLLTNPLASFASGDAMGQQLLESQKRRKTEELYASQGTQIAEGGEQALNALAALDPALAAKFAEKRLSRQSTEQNMEMQRNADSRADRQLGISEEKLLMVKQQAKLKVAEHVRSLAADERARETAALEGVLKGAASYYSKGDEKGFRDFVISKGLDPEQYSFDDFPAVAAQATGVLEALKDFNDMNNPKPADAYERYMAEEKNAGRTPLGRVEFELAKKGKGTTVYGEDGKPIVEIDGGSRPPHEIAAEENSIETATVVLDEINRARSIMGESGVPSTGFVGSRLKDVEGTKQYQLSRHLDTIKANIGFDEITALRRASKTGGALGQVTERELAFLQAVKGSLSQGQNTDSLEYTLDRIERAFMVAKFGVKGAFDQMSPEQQEIFVSEMRPEERTALVGTSTQSAESGDPMDFSTMTDEQLEAFIAKNGG